MILTIITIANIACLIGSLQAYRAAQKHENDAHTYCDGAHESAMAASRFRNEAGVHAASAADHTVKAHVFSGNHEICDTCHTLVARFEKLENGDIVCANCKG
jgi:hypothetical protein